MQESHDYTVDYDHMLAGFPDAGAGTLQERIAFLIDRLPGEWCEQYRTMAASTANIYQFSDGSFEYLFDLSSEVTSIGNAPDDQIAEDRVVAAFGRSQPTTKRRDSSRMQGFIGPTNRVFGKEYDKGHFIAHTIGGALDVNLFPQLRVINRGWSKRGKIFRQMEKYCTKNLGTFCFSRPIYDDASWCPYELEYGLMRSDGTLWIERFVNRA